MKAYVLRRVVYFISLVLSFLLYPVLNNYSNNASIARVLKIWIDDYIPLIPIFSIPYIFYLPFLFLTLSYFFFFTNLFRSISVSFIFCQIVASLFFAFLQTTVARPNIVSTDIFSRLILLIYSKDQPFNCFPSLHVSLSIISGLYWVLKFPKIVLPMTVFVILICLSTVFVKQHYLVDIIGGLILAITSFYIGLRFPQRIGLNSKSRSIS